MNHDPHIHRSIHVSSVPDGRGKNGPDGSQKEIKKEPTNDKKKDKTSDL